MNSISKTLNKWVKRTTILSRLTLFKLGLDRRPVFGVFTVTSRCDFKCKYCFSDYYLKKEKDFSTGRMFKTIDELAECGIIYLNVHGGEALLRNDIGKIINYASAKGMFINLITNGTLLEKRWDDIRKIDTLCISLDGREENNDKNRGQGAFKTAVRAIDFALSKGMTVRIVMTITRHTIDDLEWVAEWSKQRNIYIQPILLFDQENLPQELRMTRSQVQVALRKLIELKRKGFLIFYDFRTLNYAFHWPYQKSFLRKRDIDNGLQLERGFKFIPCYYKLLNVLVESNGTIRPCNVLARSAHHVSILDKTVVEAKNQLLAIDDCLYCYHLPQMEFSQLMALNIRVIFGQLVSQLREDIHGLCLRNRINIRG